MSPLVSPKFLCVLVCLVCCTLSLATEYPSPPPVPTKFENAKELQTYLGKLHNYYMIVGRPRFGKRSFQEAPVEVAMSVEEDSTEAVDDVKLLNEATELLAQWNNRLKQEQYMQRVKEALAGMKRAE